MDDGRFGFRVFAGGINMIGLLAISFGASRDFVLVAVILINLAFFLEYRFSLVSDLLSQYDPNARQREMMADEARTRSIGHQGAMMRRQEIERIQQERANKENDES